MSDFKKYIPLFVLLFLGSIASNLPSIGRAQEAEQSYKSIPKRVENIDDSQWQEINSPQDRILVPILSEEPTLFSESDQVFQQHQQPVYSPLLPLLDSEPTHTRSTTIIDFSVMPASFEIDEPVARTASAEELATTSEEPAITLETLEERVANEKKSLEGIQDEEKKKTTTEQLDRTVEWIDKARNYSKQLEFYRQGIDEAPTELKRLEAQLAQPDPSPRIEKGLDRATLEGQLLQSTNDIDRFKSQLEKLEKSISGRPERLAKIGPNIKTAQDELDKVVKKLQSLDKADQSAILAEAEKLTIETQIEMLQKELQWHNAVQKLLPLQRDSVQRKLGHAGKTQNLLNEELARLKQQETERAAEEARLAESQRHPALKVIAEENSKLAETWQELSVVIEKTRKDHDAITKELNQLTTSFNDAQAKVNASGTSKPIGVMLIEQRAKLLANNNKSSHINNVDEKVFEVKAALSELNQRGRAIENRLQELEPQFESATNPAYLVQTGRDLLNQQRSLIADLTKDYESYLSQLTTYSIVQRDLLETSRQFRFFIDKNILWIRSAPRLGKDDFESSLAGVQDIASSNEIPGFASWFQRKFNANSAGLIGVAAALLFLFAIRRFLFNRLKKANARDSLLRIMPVVRSVILSVVLSAFWPGVVATLAWFLMSRYESDTLKDSISQSLSMIAPLLFMSLVLHRISLDKGLGQVHLHWPKELALTYRKLSFRIVAFTLPFLGITFFTSYYKAGELSESLGRLAFLVSMCGLYYALSGALKSYSRYLSSEQRFKDRLLYQWRSIWIGLVILTPISLFMLSVAGWNYSAIQLGHRLLTTLLLVTSVIATAHLIYRLACIGQHLVVERRRWQHLRSTNQSADETPKPIDDEDFDIERVTSQVAGALRVGVIVSSIVIVATLWSDVLPAAKFLDEIKVGETQYESVKVVQDTDGVETTLPTTIIRDITLADWLGFAIILIVTYFLSKNVSGLMEVAILNRIPIDRGGRYAITVICRYIIGIVGIVLACRQVGFSWSNVQWLVAAMGVGLGFGLQEIFTNVVSGLIILLERPVRVGDFVTVSGQTGFVTRTQLRATTIIDYDRREMIIPNRRFITDEVTNWTLTDSVSRVIVPVGIAYGSDTKLAHDTLINIAKEHPLVLPEPDPVAIFNGFGDSTLDFELRVFIASREIIAEVRHDIHMAIDREFRKLNIEIAFPQQDIHIRSIESVLPLNVQKTDKKAA